MGFLEELAGVRQKLEENQLTNSDLVKEIEAVAQLHHDNAAALYEGENFEQYKKYWVNMLMGLSSLMDMLFGDPTQIDVKESLFPAAFLAYFLKQCHNSLRTENGTKITESMTMLLSRVLKPVNSQPINSKEQLRTCIDLLSVVLGAVDSYKRKSFRQTYIIPELNRLVQKVFQSCSQFLESGELKLTDKLYGDLASIFKMIRSLLSYEENAYAIVGLETNTLVASVKKAASVADSSDTGAKTSNQKPIKKEAKSSALRLECNSVFTKPDQDAASSLVEFLNKELPPMDFQNVRLM